MAEFRQGRTPEAKDLFEKQIALYPGIGGSSRGIVLARPPGRGRWRDRQAQAYYQKLAERFRNFYYGISGTQRRLDQIEI